MRERKKVSRKKVDNILRMFLRSKKVVVEPPQPHGKKAFFFCVLPPHISHVIDRDIGGFFFFTSRIHLRIRERKRHNFHFSTSSSSSNHQVISPPERTREKVFYCPLPSLPPPRLFPLFDRRRYAPTTISLLLLLSSPQFA